MAPDQPFLARIVALAVLSLGLSGCIDTLEGANGARRPIVNAPGVPVSLVSLDGAPDAVTNRFESALTKEASRREIALVQGSETPRYRLKGYLSAYDTEGGTALAWVWDMYDTTEKRARRIDGTTLVKRNAAEPWSIVDDAALQVAASSSMNEVAGYLTGAPPASTATQAAPARTAQVALAPPPAASQPTSFQLQSTTRPPAASNRPQPLPSVSAFAATFDLPSNGGGQPATTGGLGLLPR